MGALLCHGIIYSPVVPDVPGMVIYPEAIAEHVVQGGGCDGDVPGGSAPVPFIPKSTKKWCSFLCCSGHRSLLGSSGSPLGEQGCGFVKYGPYKSHWVRAITLNIFSNIVQLFLPYIMGKLHRRVAALSRERVAGRC